MWIKVRRMDGKESTQVDDLSKLTKIEKLRDRLEDIFDIPPAKQRLFYFGRELVDGHTLFDYNIEMNSLIQIMVRSVLSEVDDNKENSSNNIVDDEKPAKENESVLDEKPPNDEASSSTSFRWKVNDFVDGKDVTMGAWFEAIVTKVDLDENSEVRYHVVFDGYDENEIIPLTEKDIRPRARHKIPFSEIEKGMIVMANYNCDEPKERGFWYDVKITRKSGRSSSGKVFGKILLSKDKSAAEECCIMFVDEIFKIESSDETSNVPSNNEDEQPEKRKVKPDCDTCKDDPKKKCKDCSCHQCGIKDEPEKTLMCDECDQPYHMRCLNPPLEILPEDDDWYCPECKNDGSSVIKAGEKQKESQKKAKMASATTKSNRDWGKGMACSGRSKVCTIVPPNHFGPIPGVPVGSCWKYRLQASEAGVHRPHVSGIHGRDNEGVYSIVLAGGYEDDTDDGDEFTYTGSGGRDLSGNKRTAEQSFDQTLTRSNRALARNCDCPIEQKGGEAKTWQKGKPIRVIRSFKFAKHSKFAPEEGIRYDGIYKIIKYWPEKGQSGFSVWRYRLRRDDTNDAPWTKAGKKKIAELGLEIVYPEGYLEAQAKKEAEKDAKKSKRKRSAESSDEKESSEENDSSSSKRQKRGKQKRRIESSDEEEMEEKASPKKKKVNYNVSKEHQALIKKDETNKSIWEQLTENPETHKQFLGDVEEKFVCICCQDLVHQPVTVACGHSTCKSCLSRAFKAGVTSCPSCRYGLDKDYVMKVNEALRTVLVELFPGYEAGR